MGSMKHTRKDIEGMSYNELKAVRRELVELTGKSISGKGKKETLKKRILKAFDAYQASKEQPEEKKEEPKEEAVPAASEPKPVPEKPTKKTKARRFKCTGTRGFRALGTDFRVKPGFETVWDKPITPELKAQIEKLYARFKTDLRRIQDGGDPEAITP